MKIRILGEVATGGKVYARGDVAELKDADALPLISCGAAEEYDPVASLLGAPKPVKGSQKAAPKQCEHPVAKRRPTPAMGQLEAWVCACGHEGGRV